MPRRPLRPTLALLAGLVLVADCAGAGSPGTTTTGTATGDGTTTTSTSLATDGMAAVDATAAVATALAATHADPADEAWDEGLEVAVTLADGASGGGAGVEVDGDVVTITRAGTFRLRGLLTDGRVAVDAPDEGLVW